VFCPKYRRKVLVGNIEKDLRQIFYDIAKEKNSVPKQRLYHFRRKNQAFCSQAAKIIHKSEIWHRSRFY